jgi:succinate dehydrogenase flavin-adding protein (antitoxin of CptAB toxin-antitoxin module)|tara:strand:+ start:139 stop:387 length:249 start_codon:yes stop_codon:yes gene_type:complete
MSFNSLKKTIKYRVSYSGTKETDILYKRYFINQLDKFTEKDLEDIKSIFNQFSDNEIYDFLTSKVTIPLEFKEIFNKILNEE